MTDSATLLRPTAGVMPASRTLADLIDELAAAYPTKPALSDTEHTLTFPEFRALAIEFAKALHADGVRKGDKVGILMGNRIEWLVVCFAVQYLGGTMVSLNTWYTARELAYVVEHAELSVLVTVDRFLRNDYVAMVEEFAPINKTFPRLRRVVLLGDRSAAGTVSYKDFIAAGRGVPDTVIEAAQRSVAPTDIAYMLYTSGSTSRPKGVLLQHQPLIENTFQIGERLGLDNSDTLLLSISLFWGFGCENALPAAWSHGMHVVLQEHFDPLDALELLARYSCTTFYGTSNIVQALFEHPERPKYDLSALRKGVSAGSPEITRKVIESMIPFAGNVYGMTESYGNNAVSGPEDPIDKRAASVGRPLPGNEIRIADVDTGETLPAGREGEIRMRGYIMAGYYKEPQLTAQAFDADGFFRTGDLGMLDDEGFLYFRGRIKEMVKTGGMNVSPAEVEDVLRTHPAIEEAFITGLEDPVRDQIVAAVVIPRPGAALSAQQITAYCRESLSAYKVPREVKFVKHDAVPLTTTGKVHRARLPELFSPRSETS